MSVEAIAIALHHSQAAGTTKLVLVGIANHDGDGGAWPAVETLAKYAGRKVRATQDCLKELVDLGEVVVHLNAGGDASTPPDRRPNLYEIVLACPPECDRTKHHRVPGDHGYGVQSTAPRYGKRGAVHRADAVQPTAPRGVQPTAPEPSLEPTTPQPPASGGPSCARHPDGPADNCRGCGTTQRQRDERAHADALAAKRDRDKAALAADRARRAEAARARQTPTTRAAIDDARKKIHGVPA